MTKIKSFKVLVNPASGCWLVRVPDLDQSATVERLEDVEAAALDTISTSVSLDRVDGLTEEELDHVRVEVEVLPKLSTYPIPGRWLSPGADEKINAALAKAYGLTDYPGERVGPGRWVDLFWDPGPERPVGRLWTNDRDGCGLLHVDCLNGDDYTVAALTLRHLHLAGVTAARAFKVIAGLYCHGPVVDGPLDDIADLDIEVNQRFLA
jgi:hypothetical protein